MATVCMAAKRKLVDFAADADDGGRGDKSVPIAQCDFRCSLCFSETTYLGLGSNGSLGFGCWLGARVQGLISCVGLVGSYIVYCT